MLHNNFFALGLSNLERDGACIARNSTVTLASNCLASDGPDRPCELQQQRMDSICSATCDLCPGECYLMGPSGIPTCPCPGNSYVVLSGGVPTCNPLAGMCASAVLSQGYTTSQCDC